MSPLTGFLAKHLLKIRFVNLLNILSNREIVPELLQDNCTVDKIVETVRQLLENPAQNTKESLKKLGLGEAYSPSDKMASVLKEMAEKQKK